jgi:hypothetical protein
VDLAFGASGSWHPQSLCFHIGGELSIFYT